MPDLPTRLEAYFEAMDHQGRICLDSRAWKRLDARYVEACAHHPERDARIFTPPSLANDDLAGRREAFVSQLANAEADDALSDVFDLLYGFESWSWETYPRALTGDDDRGERTALWLDAYPYLDRVVNHFETVFEPTYCQMSRGSALKKLRPIQAGMLYADLFVWDFLTQLMHDKIPHFSFLWWSILAYEGCGAHGTVYSNIVHSAGNPDRYDSRYIDWTLITQQLALGLRDQVNWLGDRHWPFCDHQYYILVDVMADAYLPAEACRQLKAQVEHINQPAQQGLPGID